MPTSDEPGPARLEEIRRLLADHQPAYELIAVESVNHNKDQMAARKLIPARARPDRSKLANDTIALKDC